MRRVPEALGHPLARGRQSTRRHMNGPGIAESRRPLMGQEIPGRLDVIAIVEQVLQDLLIQRADPVLRAEALEIHNGALLPIVPPRLAGHPVFMPEHRHLGEAALEGLCQVGILGDMGGGHHDPLIGGLSEEVDAHLPDHLLIVGLELRRDRALFLDEGLEILGRHGVPGGAADECIVPGERLDPVQDPVMQGAAERLCHRRLVRRAERVHGGVKPIVRRAGVELLC